MSTERTWDGGWHYPTEVRFGVGRLHEVSIACEDAGITKPLIVTDAGLAKLPVIADVQASLEARKIEWALFSDVQANPVGENVDAGVAAMKEAGCDGVIAIGGGSALDVGKAVALMAGQKRPLWDFEDREDWYTRVDEDGVRPIIAIPTTAGTGSEVGRASVITNAEEGRKIIIFHPTMMPTFVICDPQVTVSLPKKLTAATGMDALAHNLEAFCAPGFHPLADGIALEGMRLVQRSLLKVAENGHDIEGRAEMLAASLMGATAFQKGLGAIHALSHPVGARFHAHHGMLNAIFMPYVLAFNRTVIEERLGRAAQFIGLESNFEAYLEWVLTLRKTLEIPHTIDAVGVSDDDVETLADMAAVDPASGGNPIALVADDYRVLLRAALSGTLPDPK